MGKNRLWIAVVVSLLVTICNQVKIEHVDSGNIDPENKASRRAIVSHHQLPGHAESSGHRLTRDGECVPTHLFYSVHLSHSLQIRDNPAERNPTNLYHPAWRCPETPQCVSVGIVLSREQKPGQIRLRMIVDCCQTELWGTWSVRTETAPTELGGNDVA